MPIDLSEFCGSEFWNVNVTWNTEDPDFTICFQKTILIWLPCAFLWLFSVLEVFYITNSFNRNIPYGFLNVSKLLLSGCLILLSTVDLFDGLLRNQSNDVYPVDYYTPAIKIATFALSVTLLNLNRRHGLQTSGVQFLFWFFLVVCGIPQLRTQIRRRHEHAAGNDSQYNGYSFVSYFIFYIISIAVFLLNCYADKEPLQTKYPKSANPYPENGASFLSRLFFVWFDPMAWKGYHKSLERSDLWDVKPEHSSIEIIPCFHKHWEGEVAKAAKRNRKSAQTQKYQASIVPAICKSFGPTFVFGSILKLARDLLAFASPLILALLIDFVSDGNTAARDAVKTHEPMWRGIFYAVLLFVVASTQTLLLAQHLERVCLVGLRIRTVLGSAIYKKALYLSNSARKQYTVGEIVNLKSTDAQRIMNIAVSINTIWSAPLQIILAFYFLWNLLGPAMLTGVAVMILLIPVNWFIAKKTETLQVRQMEDKDKRVKLMNEILNGIKVLKLYAWEPSFEDQVLKIREKELKVLKKAAYLNAGPSFIGTSTPFLVAFVSFATFVLIDDKNVLDVKTAFVALALFNLLRPPMSQLPTLITDIVQAKVALSRMNKFMNSDELDASSVTHNHDDEFPLSIENGTFSWGDDDPILKNINLKVKHNSLVAVVGTVGAGKSSIISAFLGEMDKVSGRVNTVGSVAYVSQQAWIQNATLQDNILFGKPMDRKRYNQVIAACALKPDIEMLPGGDATQIGEKGINLSGGQKQRVSLARAVYNDADIYLLDDPLSAVDSHVGKHIFDQVIGPNGILANKTRLLVTHGITYLPSVDNIYVMKDGEISESGTMQELVNKKGAFAEFLLQHLQEANEDAEDLDDIKHQLESTLSTDQDSELLGKLERAISRSRSESQSETASVKELSKHESSESIDSNDDNVRIRSLSKSRESQSEADPAEKTPHQNKLIEPEKLQVGSVQWDIYKHYFKNVSLWLALLIISLNIVYQAFSVGSSFWLALWANDKDAENDPSLRNMYLGVYAAFGIGQGLASTINDLVPRALSIVIARKLHAGILNGITHAPLSFYDQTPIGRILTRFSRDIDIVDKYLPTVIIMAVFYSFEIMATIFVISLSTYMFLIVIIPIAIIYYFVQRFYVPTSRQILRLETASLSPVNSHLGESIQGASTIRAYNLRKRFIAESEAKTEYNQVCYVPALISNRWLAVRLEMIGNLIILFAALFAVLKRDTISAGMVGLSLSYALQVTQTLNLLVRMICDIETHLVSVERIKEYTENEQEAPWDNPNAVAPAEWPERGDVEFKNYAVRYREGLDLVLKDVSFTVNGGEKVGIVGRTGAGKSSLTLALFRIIEAAGGSIIIDGEDISKLGLHTLRGKLTIIPQDPVLFSGSLRINLDPFGEKSDDAIWNALELAHLKTFVKGLTAGLNHEVTEGGDNLSVGQRQLICLARALLRKTKVLTLDEATAAVDLETDSLIQKTIRTEFDDCTVLTIAHRLNTIMDSDKVIVLDHGRISEFDSPATLLQDKKSAFYSMAKDAGLV